MELRCSRDLAVRLGVFWPGKLNHHRDLQEDAEYFRIIDNGTGWAMYWRWQLSRVDRTAAQAEAYMRP
jgi:hypothetical protein